MEVHHLVIPATSIETSPFIWTIVYPLNIVISCYFKRYVATLNYQNVPSTQTQVRHNWSAKTVLQFYQHKLNGTTTANRVLLLRSTRMNWEKSSATAGFHGQTHLVNGWIFQKPILNCHRVPSGNLTWLSKMLLLKRGFTRNITSKWSIFRCHVWLPEGTSTISIDYP